jgi:hypothetical protein
MGEWRCRSPFLTSALDRGDWSASHRGRFTTQGKEPMVPIGSEGGGAPEEVWTLRRRGKSIGQVGIRTPAGQSVTCRYTD